MLKPKSAAVAAAALVASVGVAGAEKMEVTHWWTSGGEAAAVSVFADAVNAAGHEWVEGQLQLASGDVVSIGFDPARGSLFDAEDLRI